MIFIEVQRMKCGKSSRMRAGTMDLAVKFRAAVIQFGNVIRVLLNCLIRLIQLAAIHSIRRACGNAASSNAGDLFAVGIDTVRSKVGIGIVNTRLSIGRQTNRVNCGTGICCGVFSACLDLYVCRLSGFNLTARILKLSDVDGIGVI